MDETDWKRLCRNLLLFVLTAIGLVWAFLLPLLGTVDLIPNDSYSGKKTMCAVGHRPYLLAFRSEISGAVFMGLILAVIIVLALLWGRRVPSGALHVVTRVVLILAVVGLACVVLYGYICANDGQVWFVPRCGATS